MRESGVIARHASTVLVGQVAVMAFGMADTIVAGRFSAQALAALSVAAAVYVSVFVALNGVLQALLPVWAELHGARQSKALGRSVRQALYLAAILMIGGTALLLFPGPLLRWTEVPAALESEVRRYLGVLILALPPALLFRMYASMSQAIGRPRLVTALQAASLALKVPLTIWFVFGGAGLPAQGAAGCAMATVCVYYAMLAAAIWLVRSGSTYREYEILHTIERPDWSAIRAFARLGIPSGLSVMVEVTSFTLMALFIARQGTVASASHQIAANLTAFMYMVPLSLSIATSARTSFWLGAGDPRMARHAIRVGFSMLGVMAVGMSGAMLLFRHGLASLYSSTPAVVEAATVLLVWVALYHLGDATQAMCVFLLRCYRVTVAPFVAYCVFLWGVGLYGGYAAAYQGFASSSLSGTPSAFWAAGAMALVMLGLILPPVLWRSVHRPAT